MGRLKEVCQRAATDGDRWRATTLQDAMERPSFQCCGIMNLLPEALGWDKKRPLTDPVTTEVTPEDLLVNDPGEQKNISETKPGLLKEMKKRLEVWQESCKRSLVGEDYAGI